MKDQNLFQPLLPHAGLSTISSAAADGENHAVNFSWCWKTGIIYRLSLFILIGIIAIWANHEASKGFNIAIINDADDSPSGQWFALFYVSNGKATRILQNTSSFVENYLYADGDNCSEKKQVNGVTLRLTTDILTSAIRESNNEYVINLNPSIIMEEANDNYAIISALQRSMARIWIWDAESTAPPWLIDGLVEYVSMLAGFGPVNNSDGGKLLAESSDFCWEDKDPSVVAHVLDYCEEHKKGFIQRLNGALREPWQNQTVDDSFGVCSTFVHQGCNHHRI